MEQQFSWGRVLKGVSIFFACLIVPSLAIIAFSPPSPARTVTPADHSTRPDHYYSFVENGQFGYLDGGGSGVVEFVTFRGRTAAGRWVLQRFGAHEFTEMWCDDRCELVHIDTVHTYGTAATTGGTVVNPQPGTILWEMVQDMLNGKMDRVTPKGGN